MPVIKRLGVPLIAFTGNPALGARAQRATCTWTSRVPAEACPLNLAPTASTTAALAVGDALAVTLLKARGFTEEDFARSHPGRQPWAGGCCCTSRTSCAAGEDVPQGRAATRRSPRA